MSFWQKAYESGLAMSKIPPEQLGFAFPPLYHDVGAADALVELDKDGKLMAVTVLPPKNRPRIIFPITIESMKRTSDAAYKPHGLCDNPKNMGPEYVAQLEAWANHSGSPFLAAILNYMKAGTFADDMEKFGVDDKARVAWVVYGLDEPENCWENVSLFNAWIDYYEPVARASHDLVLCQISGQMDVLQEKAPKGIIPGHGNGKLVSSDNTDDYVFKGMFQTAIEAATMGVRGCHFAHAALKWIFHNGSVNIGGNDMLAVWSPMHPTQALTGNFIGGIDTTSMTPFVLDSAELWKTVFASKEPVVMEDGEVVTCITTWSVKGRDSIAFYKEGKTSEFLDRMMQWVDTCSWEKWNFEEETMGFYSPSLEAIIAWAFGSPTKDKTGRFRMEVSDSYKALWMRRLVDCKAYGRKTPTELVRALVARANKSVCYPTAMMPVVMAVLRRYMMENGKNAGSSLDPENTNRSYVLGRLLAVYRKIEEEFLFAKDETRTTQAEEMQNIFASRPLTVAAQLDNRAHKVWLPRLSKGRRIFWETLLEEIYGMLSSNDNSKLDAEYLFGYYAQRKELFKARTDKTEESV